MKVISPTFPGRLIICFNCGALLNYNTSDIYGSNLVYCPLCKASNTIEFDKNYNGIIKPEEKKDVQS